MRRILGTLFLDDTRLGFLMDPLTAICDVCLFLVHTEGDIGLNGSAHRSVTLEVRTIEQGTETNSCIRAVPDLGNLHIDRRVDYDICRHVALRHLALRFHGTRDDKIPLRIRSRTHILPSVCFADRSTRYHFRSRRDGKRSDA